MSLPHPDPPSTTPTLLTEAEEEKAPAVLLEAQEHVWPELSTAKTVGLVTTMTLAMMLNIMQVQIVNLSLEQIGSDLNILVVNLQWLASAYSLAFGALLLLFGRIADIVGHKKMFLIGMSWLAIWSIGVALAPNEVAIDIFRAMQGAGAGAAIPAALGILGSSFPPGQTKITAFACFSGGAPLGGSIGLVVGGVLTEYAPIGWRAGYYVSAGVAVLIVLGAMYYVPADHKRNPDLTVDWIGGFLITAGLTFVTFALADGSGQEKGWRTPYIPVLFSLGILLLTAFWFFERHLEYNTNRAPLMKTSLWFKERFALVALIGALGWSCFASYMFFATLFFQDYMGLSPAHATLRFLPSPVTGIILNVIVAIVASRVDAQWLIALGALGTGLSPLLYALQNIDDPYWQWQFPGMILAVFGADFIFACGIMYVSKVAGPGQQALAGGLFNMCTQIGTAFGLAINTIIQSRVTQHGVEKLGQVYDVNSTELPKPAVLEGLRAAFFGCAGFAFAALLIALVGLHGIGRVGHRHRKPKVEDGGVAEEKK